MEYNSLFTKLSRNTVKLNFEATSMPLPVGSSKFGGQPDVPNNFVWPYYTYLDKAKIEHTRPLSFLLQINCATISDYDTDRLLPQTGMLLFFYELETMTWGYDPQHKGSAKVYYFDDSDLLRAEFPSDLDEEYHMPEMSVTFNSRLDLPDYEEFAEHYGSKEHGGNFEAYNTQREKFGYEEVEDDRNKLLGYANIIQNDMLMECEMSTNGIYNGHAVNLNDEHYKTLSENCEQWKLLLQMDTVANSDFELMFGDCGHIYFYIKETDLANQNFDNCWLVLQCC